MDQLCRTSLSKKWPLEPIKFFLHRNSESKISCYNIVVIEKDDLNDMFPISYIYIFIYPKQTQDIRLRSGFRAEDEGIWLNHHTLSPSTSSRNVLKLGADSGGGQVHLGNLSHGHSLDARPSHNPKMQCVCAQHMKSFFDAKTYQHGSENPCFWLNSVLPKGFSWNIFAAGLLQGWMIPGPHN